MSESSGHAGDAGRHHASAGVVLEGARTSGNVAHVANAGNVEVMESIGQGVGRQSKEDCDCLEEPGKIRTEFFFL